MRRPAEIQPVPAGRAPRGTLFVAYAVVSYLVGVAGLGLLVLRTLGALPGGDAPAGGSPWPAVAIDLCLLVLFGLQHSVMARAHFKERLAVLLPAALERSTYVWSSGLALGLLAGCWQPLGGVLWQAGGLARWLLLGGGLAGWLYLLAATFAINHWDLFGLRQAWLAARGRDAKPVPFTERWMYRYSRHPIQAGVLAGLWLVPTMTATQALLGAGLTGYMVVGLVFEERDLMQHWGERYREYRQRVGALFTLPWAR